MCDWFYKTNMAGILPVNDIHLPPDPILLIDAKFLQVHRWMEQQISSRDSLDILLSSLFMAWPYTTLSRQTNTREAQIASLMQSHWGPATNEFWVAIKDTRDQLTELIKQYK